MSVRPDASFWPGCGLRFCEDSVVDLLCAALQVPKMPKGMLLLLSYTAYPAGMGAVLAVAP